MHWFFLGFVLSAGCLQQSGAEKGLFDYFGWRNGDCCGALWRYHHHSYLFVMSDSVTDLSAITSRGDL